MEKQQWPTNIMEVAPYLDAGNEALKDPWGQLYQATVIDQQAEDGTTKQRPQIMCQPPGGKPAIIFPTK
jgi:hypothetical protein